MKVEYVKIKQIRPYERNPRRNKKSVEYVANSLREYGFKQPIVVDKNMTIIVGHTRFQAAKEIGITEIPILIAEDLTEEQVRAYRIADNKTHEYALWDDSLLSEELDKLLDQNDIAQVSYLTAFSELEIDKLLNGKTFEEDQSEEAKQTDQKEFSHRVALLVLKNSYVNRGVATAVNGWLEWGLRCGVQVDVISDSSSLSNNQFTRYKEVSNWVASNEQAKDNELANLFNLPEFTEESIDLISADHEEQVSDQSITMRYPIIRLEEAVRLRSSLVKALKNHTYDAIILNTVDTLFAAISIGLHNELDNLYYTTHSEDDIGLGNRKYFTPITHALLRATNLKILCQSERTRREFLKASQYDPNLVYFMPYHIGQPEFQLFKQVDSKKGVLYIGPYEDRKDPETYIQALKASGLPALCITPSETSARKFKQRFLTEGIEHEIHVALTGKHKVEVMQRAAVALIPSREETFCFTAYEAAHCCPTIVPLERDWTEAHALWCYRVPLRDISTKLKELYNQPITEEAKQALLKNTEYGDQMALRLIQNKKSKFPANNALTKWLDKVGQGSLKDFYQTRPTVVIDELYFALRLQTHEDYEVIQTKDDTMFKIKNR